MSDNVYQRTAVAVIGYVNNNCPDKIYQFGKSFSPDKLTSFLLHEDYSWQQVNDFLEEYLSLIKLVMKFMNKSKNPESFIYFCTLKGLIAELIRATPIQKPIKQNA